MNFNEYIIREIGEENEFFIECENILLLNDGTTIKLSNINNDFLGDLINFIKDKAKMISYSPLENSLYIDYPSLNVYKVCKVTVFKEIKIT